MTTGDDALRVDLAHHVRTTLGALGLEVPDLDGWTYWADGRG
jgi:hypothetical protein